jgi:hypothetical protein
MGDRRGVYRMRRLEGKRPIGNLGVDRIILKCMFKKCEGERRTGLT